MQNKNILSVNAFEGVLMVLCEINLIDSLIHLLEVSSNILIHCWKFLVGFIETGVLLEKVELFSANTVFPISVIQRKSLWK